MSVHSPLKAGDSSKLGCPWLFCLSAVSFWPHDTSPAPRRHEGPARAGGKRGVAFHALACLCREEIRAAQSPLGNILKLLMSRRRMICNPGESRCRRGARPGGFSLKPGGELRIE